MSFIDRTGENLGRKKIIIINQTENEIIADIVRADSPEEEGTPINASVFNKFQEEIKNANDRSDYANTKSTTAELNASTALNKVNTLFSFDGVTLTIKTN